MIAMNERKIVKICHMTSAHQRYDQRILYRECISLQKEGYDVTLIVNDEKEDEKFRNIYIKSTKHTYSKNRLKRMIFGTYHVYRLALNENADIYHFHDPELLFFATKLKKKNKMVIFDSHENYPDRIRYKYYIPKKIRNIIAMLYYSYESIILKKIDGVIFPTLMNEKNIFEGRSKNIAFVNNTPDLDEIPANIHNQDVKKEGICYAGGLTYDRGILFLMQAAYKAKVPLYLAGKFFPPSFEIEIMNRKESAAINYMGILDREEIYQLYNKCCIGMCTLLNKGQYSQSDNLPTKAYEYMAMGLPVILSDFPYNRKVIEKYKFGMLVNPEDPDDIAEKINFLISHENEAIKMGRNGKRLVYEKWNWKNEAAKLLQLYEVIIKERIDSQEII